MTTPKTTSGTAIPSKSSSATAFDDVKSSGGKAIAGISAITVYADTVVNGIQASYVLADGTSYAGPVNGGTGGTKTVVTIGADQALVEIAATNTGSGIAKLSFAVIDEAGKITTYGPFGSATVAAPTVVGASGSDVGENHDLLLGGTSDQGFTFFGSKAAALCGEIEGGKPVGLGVYTLPLVDPGSGVSATTALSQDYRPSSKDATQAEEFTNYRMILTVPASISSVDIWAESQVAVTVGTEAYTLDPVKKTTVSTNAVGKVVIGIEATSISVPALKIKTSDMTGHWQWCSIYPDAPAHSKIASLPADTLYNNRAQLGIGSQYTQTDCANVQKAISSIASVAAQVKTDLGHVPSVASTSSPNWVLDVSGNGVSLKNLTASQASAAAVAAKAVANATTKAGQSWSSFTHSVSKVTHVATSSVSSGVSTATKAVSGAAESAASTVAKGADTVGSEVASDASKVAADAAKLKSDFTSSTSQLGGDLSRGDFSSFGKDLLGDTEKLGMDVATMGYDVMVTVVTAAGDTLVYTLDHAGKFGELILGILKAIGGDIEKVLNFLREIFDWKTYVAVQKMIVSKIESTIATVVGLDASKLKANIDAKLDAIKASADQSINSVIKTLGGVGTDGKVTTPAALATAASTAKTDASKAVDAAERVIEYPMEKLDWLLSKTLDHVPGASIFEKMLSLASKDLAAVEADLEQCVASVTSDLTTATAAALDDLMAIAKNLDKAPELFVCALLEFAEGLLDAGIDVVKGVVNVVIDALAAFLKFGLQVVSATIDIPFLSSLYKTLTGEDLSFLGLNAFLVAVPATIAFIAAKGRAPNFSGQLAQSDTTDDYLAFTPIASGIAQILQGLLVGGLDAKAVMTIKQQRAIARAESIAAGATAADAVTVYNWDATGNPWIEGLSWLCALANQTFSAPTDFDKGESALEDALWFYGLIPLAADAWSMWWPWKRTTPLGRRLVRLSDKFGAELSTLLSFLALLGWAIDSGVYKKKISGATMAGNLIGPSADLLQAITLYATSSPSPWEAAILGGGFAAAGIASGVLSIVSA